MTGMLAPPQKAMQARPQPIAALRVQSSLAGQPRAIVWGLARLAGNLIGNWDFYSQSYSESTQGGKGGGGAPISGYNYFARIGIGLCEGPIAAVRQAWSNKAPETLASLGLTLFSGGYGQGPWGWLVANDQAYAQNFRGLAYVAGNLALGTSASLPNLSFEVRGAVSGAVTETAAIPATSPYTVQAQYFDIVGNAAAEEITVPYAAPYQYIAQNPAGLPYQNTAQQGSGIVIGPSTGSIIGGPSTGVYYTDTDPPQFLTAVSGAPSQGQFNVDAGAPYAYSFAAADAGQNVTIVDLAVSPGVNYATIVSGTVSAGSMVVTGIAPATGIPVGYPVVAEGVLPPGTTVSAVAGGAATVDLSSGSTLAALIGGSYEASVGTPVTDSAGAVPAGTSIAGTGGAVVTLSEAAAQSATETLSVALSVSGIWGAGDGTATLAASSGIAVGATVTDLDGYIEAVLGSGAQALIGAIAGDVVTITDVWGDPVGNIAGAPDIFIVTTSVAASLAKGSTQVTGIANATPFIAGAAVSDQLGLLPAGTSVAASAGTSLILSRAATANAANDVLTFPAAMTLSQPALVSGTVALVVVEDAMQQVVGLAPSQGQFTLTPAGLYSFAAADAGRSILITDVADANPADVVRDFLTNPYYGLPLFPADRLGDLSDYANYCRANGLFVSPVLASQQQATQLLQDLMSATNSAVVWGNGGTLTIVPYGDAAASGNGATWSPPTAPLYSLDDDDFLPNQATNSASVSAADSPDPVTVTRLDPADQVNDVQVEYLDRAQDYNPTIAEAQDDAAINLYGLKPSGSKQLHLICDRRTAIQAAELQLGRQQVRNLYSFTLDRKYILLDPMDIVAITDAGLGLDQQWVRIREITENDDRSLSIVAEEYLAGTGSAPVYGRERGNGAKPNWNVAPGNALQPIFIDAPPQAVKALGMEMWLATAGGPNWGGCEVWLSTDNVSFHYAGTMNGSSCMGTLTANFAAGSDPDTADTCSVDLTESQGSLIGGSQADADNDRTLCFVCNSDGSNGEFFTYEQATLTAQYKYDLGKHGGSAGYLRRGLYGSAIAAHASGSLFARLRAGSVFALPYDKSLIGTTLYVKLLSFNLYGGGQQALADVASYAFTVGGAAPALSSVGALALASDLASGAATATYSGAGTSGGATSAGTTMALVALSGVSGTLSVQVSGFFGPGSGTPAASSATVTVTRLLTGGGATTVQSGQAIALPASANVPFAFAFLDTPDPSDGKVTYEVSGTSNAGVAPYGPTTITIVESRR